MLLICIFFVSLLASRVQIVRPSFAQFTKTPHTITAPEPSPTCSGGGRATATDVFRAAVAQGFDYEEWKRVNLEHWERLKSMPQRSQRAKEMSIDAPEDVNEILEMSVRTTSGSNCLNPDDPYSPFPPPGFVGDPISMECLPRNSPCGYGTFIYPDPSKQLNRACNFTLAPAPGDPIIKCRFCPADQVCSGNQCKNVFGMMEETCSSAAQCEPVANTLLQAIPRCIGGFCTQDATGLGINGDYCSSAADCIAGMTCISDMPGSPTRCRNTGSCATHTECLFDQYCSAGTCVARKDVNVASTSTNQCKIGLVTNTTHCVPWFSLFNGAVCTDATARLLGCEVGLQCVNVMPGWRCLSDNAGEMLQVCFNGDEITTSSGGYSYTTYDDSTCPEGWECICELSNANDVAHCRPLTPPTRYYAVEWNNLADCAIANGCRLEQEAAYPTTCIANHCISEFSCLQRTIETGLRPDRLILPGCSGSDAAHLENCVGEAAASSLHSFLWRL